MFYKPKRGIHAGKRFKSYQSYRNRLARDKGYKSYSAQRNEQSKSKGFRSYYEERKTKASNEYRERKLSYLNNVGRLDRSATRTFDKMYAAVLKDRRENDNIERLDHDGPLAQFLNYIGVRPFSQYGHRDIGDYEEDD